LKLLGSLSATFVTGLPSPLETEQRSVTVKSEPSEEVAKKKTRSRGAMDARLAKKETSISLAEI